MVATLAENGDCFIINLATLVLTGFNRQDFVINFQELLSYIFVFDGGELFAVGHCGG